MAAFDVTTKPVSLNLKPGSTGSIMVVVSNRLGKPVMGLVEGALTPTTVAGWLVPPPPAEAQRRYEADPAATANLEFKVVVPADAVSQDVQFKATVRDVLAPDDTKVEGQTVAIKVTREPPPNGGKKIPLWVWIVVGVLVLAGAGFGIFKAVQPKSVPDVVGMSAEEATEELKDAGFDSVTVTDTLGDQTKDTNRVIRQAPEADAEIPDTVSPKVATIVVNRPATEIPVVANQPVSVAIERLRQRDLVLGSTSGQYTGNIAQNQTISRTFPTEGTRVAVKSAVNLVIYAYSTTPPPDCPNLRSCVVQLPRDLEVQLEGLRRTRVQ